MWLIFLAGWQIANICKTLSWFKSRLKTRGPKSQPCYIPFKSEMWGHSLKQVSIGQLMMNQKNLSPQEGEGRRKKCQWSPRQRASLMHRPWKSMGRVKGFGSRCLCHRAFVEMSVECQRDNPNPQWLQQRLWSLGSLLSYASILSSRISLS